MEHEKECIRNIQGRNTLMINNNLNNCASNYENKTLNNNLIK